MAKTQHRTPPAPPAGLRAGIPGVVAVVVGVVDAGVSRVGVSATGVVCVVADGVVGFAGVCVHLLMCMFLPLLALMLQLLVC